MGPKYLIDTDVMSHLFAYRLPQVGKKFVTEVINIAFNISVAVEIEVLTFCEVPNKMPLMEEFIALATVLPLGSAVTKKQSNYVGQIENSN